jgi:DNA replication licensing factor MCM6
MYVRESFRLLRKSIIHVETEDVTFDEGDEFDDAPPEENNEEEGGGQENNQDDAPAAEAPEGNDDEEGDEAEPKKAKKSKKKTQITFEQYEAVSNAIATYLRSRESDAEEVEGEESEDSTYLKWGQVVEWYLEQCESTIGDSMEELNRMRKLTNLVLRRLVKIDHVLVVIGDADIPELERKLAVHPNYVVG